MRLIIILSSALIIQAGVVKEEKRCKEYFINNQYYEEEELKKDLDRPFLLAVDFTKNTLYFSYSLNKDDDTFKSAYIDLDTKEFGEIGVDNGFAQSVDQLTHDVYIGASNGIYKYDHKTKKAEFFGAKDVDIWSVYFKDVVYYSDFPEQFLYEIIDGKSVRVKDLEDTKVDHFVLDNEDTFYYTNHTGLYSQKKGSKDAVFYQAFPEEGVRGISIDVNGKVYICIQDGIYSVEKETASLKKVIDLDDAFGIAFDKDNNFIYSDALNVYRLKANEESKCGKKT